MTARAAYNLSLYAFPGWFAVTVLLPIALGGHSAAGLAISFLFLAINAVLMKAVAMPVCIRTHARVSGGSGNQAMPLAVHGDGEER